MWVYWYRKKGGSTWQASTEAPSWLNTHLYELVVTDRPPPGYEPPPPAKPLSAYEQRPELVCHKVNG
jgi:hypothetical protein